MGIQFRRGLKTDLDPSLLLPGEPAFALDTQELLVGNGEGGANRFSTDQDFEVYQAQIDDLKDDFQGQIDNLNTSLDQTEENINNQKGQPGGFALLPDPLPPVGTLLKLGAGGVLSSTKLEWVPLLSSPVLFTALNSNINIPIPTLQDYPIIMVVIGPGSPDEECIVTSPQYNVTRDWRNYATKDYNCAGRIFIGQSGITAMVREIMGWSIAGIKVTQVFGLRLS